jgi:putative MATE family efflux protein
MFFVAPLGDSQIASITITASIIAISQALAMGMMIAGTALISQYLGAKKVQDAKKVASQLLILSTGIGIVFNILLFFLTPAIMNSMGATGDTFAYSVQYVRIRSFEMVPLFIFYAFHASRQSSGDTSTPVYLNTGSILLNILLTWIFVSLMGMGVAGAAYSTLIANTVIMPVALFMLFFDKKSEIVLTKKSLKPNMPLMWTIFNLGWPSAISQALTSFGFLIINAITLSYGDATVSGFGVANRINMLLLMPAMGIGGVLATFVGQNIGAENVKRAKKSVWAAMALSAGVCAVGAAILLPIRGYLVGIFLSGEAYDISKEYLIFLLAGLPLMGVFQTFMGSYQGAGRTDLSLALSMIRLWGLRLPLIWLFAAITPWGVNGMWYAMVLSNVGAGILGLLFYSFLDFKPRIRGHKIKFLAMRGDESEDPKEEFA